jgi:hypothetical protein
VLSTEFRPKPKACAQCKREFLPARPMQNVCGPRCAGVWSRAVSAQKRAQERALDKERRDKLKKITTLEAECRDIVQEIARIRDRHDGCISCHMPAHYDGIWNGSHYRPAGTNSAVQFHLWNIHKACAQCKLYKGGNITAYRPRLVEKIGEDRVAWLDSQTQVTRYTREYLMRFKTVMGKRLRRVRKSARKEA